MKSELRVGMPAPDFELPGIDGRRITLSEHRGSRVLLAFLRNAQCAVCNLWVHETCKLAPHWQQRGLEVIAVFESEAAKLSAQFEGQEPPIAIAADPDGRVHELFDSRNDPARIETVMSSGVGEPALRRAASAGFPVQREQGANFFRLPVEVLLDAHGIVRVVHHADEVVNHLPRPAIEAFLAASGVAGAGAPL